MIQGYTGQLSLWRNRKGPVRRPGRAAGDSLYEYCYLREFAESARWMPDYDGDVLAWWADFRSRVACTKKADQTLLMVLGCSACFSADPDGTVRLPFDPVTGRPADPEVCQHRYRLSLAYLARRRTVDA